MTKQELRQYRDHACEIDMLARSIERVKTQLYNYKSIVLDGMPKGGKRCNNVEYLIDLKERLICEYIARQQELHNEMMQVECAIMRLDNQQCKDVLGYRYLDGYRWDEIANLMHYDIRQIYRLHGKALLAIR